MDISAEEQDILCRIHVHIPAVESEVTVQLLCPLVAVRQHQFHRRLIRHCIHEKHPVRSLHCGADNVHKSIAGSQPVLYLSVYIQLFEWLLKYSHNLFPIRLTHIQILSIIPVHGRNCAVRQYDLQRVARFTAALPHKWKIFPAKS